MEDSELIREVLELTLACQRGDASDEECARLERLLLDSSKAVECYLRVVDDTLTLRETAGAIGGEKSRRDRLAADPQDASYASLKSSGLQSLFSRTHARGIWGWSIAIALLLMAGWMWLSSPSRTSAAKDAEGDAVISARIANLANVRWSADAESFKEWSLIHPGDTLRIDSGLVNVIVSSGVELLIEGPADAEFVSLDKVIARQGKFAARVGPGAVGFQIVTPHAQVIDRGTSFGLSVNRQSQTDVVVYEGTVDLDVLGDQPYPRRRLVTGEALRVDWQGQLSRITTVQSADFLEPPHVLSSAVEPPPLITAVSDNIRSLETTKYYRIISHGFVEDCRAYVDRLHEWNSLGDGGLPAFLRGGDYVMTFNDDKIMTEIELAVTVSRPCRLFVILDDRVPTPDWLARDFVDTQYDVGSDEGWDYEENEVIKTGVGPGESNDHICSIWRRDVLEPATVVLGALSSETAEELKTDMGRSMYGIVAVPLERGNAN